jgi:hypothetical protein
MSKLFSHIAFALFLFLLITVFKRRIRCQQSRQNKYFFDSTLVKAFFNDHPQLKNYQSDVEKLYRKHQFHYIWYSNNRVNEFGNLLHNKLSNLEEEGIQDAVPYKDKLDRLMNILTSVRNQVLNLNYYIQRSIFILTKCIMV